DRAKAERSKQEVLDLLNDELTGPLLKKIGISKLEDYEELDDKVKAEISKMTKAFEKQQKDKADLAVVRGQLRANVKERSQAKTELLKQEKVIDPEAKRGTFKRMKGDAETLVEDIQAEEVKKVMDDLLIKGEQSIRNFLDAAYVKKTGYPDIITEGDIIKTGDLGPKYEWAIRNEYHKKLVEIMPGVVAKWLSENPAIAKEQKASGIEDYLMTKLRHARGLAEKGVDELEGTIRKDDNAEKFEKVKPKLDGIFSELNDRITSNPFGHNLKSFEIVNSRVVVFNFYTDTKKDSVIGKYLNWTSGGEKRGDMWSDKIYENLGKLEEGAKEVEKVKTKFQTEKNRFNKKGVFSQLWNREQGKRIDDNIKAVFLELDSYEAVGDLLKSLSTFIDAIRKIESDSSVSLNNLKSGPYSGLDSLKGAYLKALEQKLKA
ncbi:MAG: hypothetical protein WCJ59_03660, partial [bacterium]